MKRDNIKARKGSLTPLRKKITRLMRKALKQVTELQKSGVPSRALDEAIRTILPSRRDLVNSGELQIFSVDDKHRKRELLREERRIKEFLNSYSSTVEGAKLEASQIFRNQVNANNKFKGVFAGRNVDYDELAKRLEQKGVYTSTGDYTQMAKDVASIAFRAYRMVVENSKYANLIYYEGGYGSNNLINYIYQVVEENPAGWASGDLLSEVGAREAREMLDEFEKIRSDDAEFERNNGDNELGAFYTTDKERSRQAKTFWQRNGFDF